MGDEVINKVVCEATTEIVGMMSGLSIESGQSYQLSEAKSLGNVSVIIGFSGSKILGAMVLHYSRDMALALSEMIFGAAAEDFTSEVIDAVGEVTNMICGKVKTDLVNNGESDFTISVPTVIIGDVYQTRVKCDSLATVYPFTSEDQNKFVHFEIKYQRF